VPHESLKQQPHSHLVSYSHLRIGNLFSRAKAQSLYLGRPYNFTP
jgi:hypothetical protein